MTFLILLMVFSVGICAEEKGQSIMYKDQKNEYGHLTKIPEGEKTELGDKCMEMSRQIRELKGKPQRRYALKEQFRVECQERP